MKSWNCLCDAAKNYIIKSHTTFIAHFYVLYFICHLHTQNILIQTLLYEKQLTSFKKENYNNFLISLNFVLKILKDSKLNENSKNIINNLYDSKECFSLKIFTEAFIAILSYHLIDINYINLWLYQF